MKKNNSKCMRLNLFLSNIWHASRNMTSRSTDASGCPGTSPQGTNTALCQIWGESLPGSVGSRDVWQMAEPGSLFAFSPVCAVLVPCAGGGWREKCSSATAWLCPQLGFTEPWAGCWLLEKGKRIKAGGSERDRGWCYASQPQKGSCYVSYSHRNHFLVC